MPVADAIQLVWMVSAFGNQKSTYSRIPLLSLDRLPSAAGRAREGAGDDYFWLPNLLTIDTRSNGVVLAPAKVAELVKSFEHFNEIHDGFRYKREAFLLVKTKTDGELHRGYSESTRTSEGIGHKEWISLPRFLDVDFREECLDQR